MDFIREELEKMVTNLQTLEQNYIEELSNSPPGNLFNNRSCGMPRYYHNYHAADGMRRRKYLPPGDPMINKLTRKEYLKVSLPAIRNNIKILQQALSRYQSLDPQDIINMTKRAYKLLPDKSFFYGQAEMELWDAVQNLEYLTDELIEYRYDQHKAWAEEDYPRNNYEYRGLHLTSFGLRVRSRGEIVIADQTHTLGIPFRYDQLIRLNDGSTISPDFTFENKYYEEFYLEYCGMMDDPYYVKRNLKKRARYERNGINEWNNIRYLYSKDDSLNAVEIKHILLDWVVPKL